MCPGFGTFLAAHPPPALADFERPDPIASLAVRAGYNHHWKRFRAGLCIHADALLQAIGLILMVLFRSLLFEAFFYTNMTLFGIVLAPVTFLSRRLTAKFVQTFCQAMMFALKQICGLRTEVRGEIPQGEVLIASKHQSFLDVLILLSVLDTPRFVMKKELRFTPVFSWYAKGLGCIVVDRSAGRTALEAMLAAIRKAKGELGQLVIYPQGTRVAPGARRPYRAGVAAAYVDTGLPCVPAATNTGVFWGRNSVLRRPGIAVVEFLPPIRPGLEQDQALARIEAAVESASDSLRREGERSSNRPFLL